MCCVRYIAGCSLRKLLAFLCLFLPLSAGTAAAGNVTFTLALRDGKTEYRSGEPIILQLTFFTAEPGSLVDTAGMTPAPLAMAPPYYFEKVVITPRTDAFPWMEAQRKVYGRHSPDNTRMMKLEPNKPVTLHLALNDSYRFTPAGRYSVHVITRRVYTDEDLTSDRLPELTSNEVSFEVLPLPEQQEAEIAASLERRIRASTDLASAQLLAEQLDYLPGDAATRAKLSLLLNPKV